jgi:hypothetical protein
MTRTADQIVNQEVLLCVSHLVSTLAAGYGSAIPGEPGDLADMIEQAFELASPIPDYESAAREAGWQFSGIAHDGAGFQQFWNPTDPTLDFWEASVPHEKPLAWEDLCRENDIDPYDREVFEHWAVTSWLADKLEAKGEKVDRDFAGMIVWARTTTGQMISADWVIEQIAADLAGDYPATLAERFQQGA